MPSTDDVTAVLAAHLPGYRVGTVARLGAGLDNLAYEVNDDLVVRFALSDVDMTREARLLEVVAEVSPLPVPRPLLVLPGCLVYRKLPGTVLLHDPDPAVVPQLARMLTAIHAIPLSRLEGLVEVDDTPPAQWRAEAERHMDLAGIRVALGQPPPPGEFVFCHNDLGAEHILVHDGAVTGVIDWSDAAIADPAVDFGLILRDLGVMLAEDPAARQRAVFYARCKALEDIVYGTEAGRETYVDNGLRALRRLAAYQD